MNDLDLEIRLRDTLHDQANTVTRSPHPRADLAARLARREKRRPLLAVAAAVFVVAAAAVPVVVLSQREEPAPIAASPFPTKWVELAEFVEDGVSKKAGLSIDADGKGWCVKVSAVDAEPKPYACYGVPAWGNKAMPTSQRYVASVAVLGDDPQLSDLMLFVTAPQVTTLAVVNQHDTPVLVREVARTADAVYFLADFDGSATRGAHYLARDREGKTVAETR
jgi:hypothetical protein